MRYLLYLSIFSLIFCFPVEGVTKDEVHSFDVFDTLVGRLHKDPISVFRLVEERYPYPGFTKLRIEAYTGSNGTLNDIYRNFITQNKLSLKEGERLKAFELETELSNVFPIASNLSKVQDGDILVSDTYYNNAELEQILREIGLNKRVHLFATPNGKRFGTIWPQLKKQFKILSHLGDNYHSDVKSPEKYGIKGVLCTKTDDSPMEQKVRKAKITDLADLMRVLRLLNPYQENSLKWFVWNEQAQMNVPILILGSLELNSYCKKKNSLLFSARGCCHFIKIFKKLFPTYKSTYFQTSRYIYMEPTTAYIKYVKSLYSFQSLIVDELGSGTSCRLFFKRYFSTTPNYISLLRSYGRMPCIVNIGPLANINFDFNLESLNYDLKGSLIGFNDNGPVHTDPEYPLEDVQPAHDCINKCISLLDQYRIQKFDKKLLKTLMKEVIQYRPVLFQFHVEFHKKPGHPSSPFLALLHKSKSSLTG